MEPTTETDIEPDIDETVAALLKPRESAFQKAKENIKKAQQSQKETYNRKHVQSEMSVGTKVWLENTPQRERKGGKMDPVWLGPYVINRSVGKGLYGLKNSNGEVLKKKANIARLKPFISRDPAKSEHDEPPSDGPPSKKRKANDDDHPPSNNPAPPPSKKKANDTWVTINKCKLTEEHKDVLLDGKWLSDVHIHAAHLLMKSDCDAGGMQNPLRGQDLSFKPEGGEFIQILHSAGNHWLTVSNIGTEAANTV